MKFVWVIQPGKYIAVKQKYLAIQAFRFKTLMTPHPQRKTLQFRKSSKTSELASEQWYQVREVSFKPLNPKRCINYSRNFFQNLRLCCLKIPSCNKAYRGSMQYFLQYFYDSTPTSYLVSPFKHHSSVVGTAKDCLTVCGNNGFSVWICNWSPLSCSKLALLTWGATLPQATFGGMLWSWT